jgi:hypothetical protein
MSHLPPRIRIRLNDRSELSPRQALILAELAMKDDRCRDAERLIEIVYDRIESRLTPD